MLRNSSLICETSGLAVGLPEVPIHYSKELISRADEDVGPTPYLQLKRYQN